MTTNVWLKIQPNKKIAFPDCYPSFNIARPKTHEDFVHIKDEHDRLFGSYLLSQIVRIETRP